MKPKRIFILSTAIVGVLFPWLAMGQDDRSDDQRNGEPKVEECRSLLGQPLYRPEMNAETFAKLNEELDLARQRLEDSPNDVESRIWYGRRLAYLWRYRDAVQVFSEGIDVFPDNPHLYRHRGHRWITLRQFDRAVEDLQRAAELIADSEDEIEEDGQPNSRNTPTSTLHTNIYYHLGLAHYLNGDFDQALAAYQKCLAASKNPDMRVATLDWMYMTLHYLGRPEQADEMIREVQPDWDVIENHAYFRRLLMYQRKLNPEQLLDDMKEATSDLDWATYGYGIGNWHRINGESDKANQMFERVLKTNHWAAFGYIAAEVAMAREK